MKITVRKNLDEERLSARKRLDEAFAFRLEQALDPKAALYAVKFAAAQTAPNALVSADEAALVLVKHAEYLEAVAAVEADRQAAQAAIDTAANVFEIEAALAAA